MNAHWRTDYWNEKNQQWLVSGGPYTLVVALGRLRLFGYLRSQDRLVPPWRIRNANTGQVILA